MSALAERLHGKMVRPAEVVELAATAGLDLAAGVVCLVKESHGGRNVWGHDGVSTGGLYVKGGPVTRDNYLAYKARRKELGAQGVGPTQLTHPSIQDAADAAGGCWVWRVNVLTGFRHLAQLQERYGVRDGFRRYNGSGPRAEAYAGDAMARLEAWRSVLDVPAPADRELAYGMRGDAEVARLQAFLRDVFPDYAGDLPVTGNYLEQTAAAVREFQRRARVMNPDGSRPDGRNVGPRTRAALARHGF